MASLRRIATDLSTSACTGDDARASGLEHPRSPRFSFEYATQETLHTETIDGDRERILNVADEDGPDNRTGLPMPASPGPSDGERTEAPSSEQAPTFTAIGVPLDYPPLDYLPTALTAKVTISVAIFYVTVACAILGLYLRADRNEHFVVQNVHVYLTVHFGPALVAAISTTLIRNMIQELRRMLPYMNMADQTGAYTGSRGKYTVTATYWPLPKTINSRSMGLLAALSYFVSFLTPLKTLLVQIIDVDGRWIVVVHRDIAMATSMFYLLLAIFVGCITYKLWKRETGLRRHWDPKSFVDILALFYHSNLNQAAIEDRIPIATMTGIRLGYWKRVQQDRTDIVYGIRFQDRPEPHETIGGYPMREGTGLLYRRLAHSRVHTEQLTYPYRETPLISWDFYMAIAISFALLPLLLYALAAGFVTNGFVVHQTLTILRLDRANVTASTHLPSVSINGTGEFFFDKDEQQAQWLLLVNFVLRTLPIGYYLFCLGYIYTLDAHHRFTQPLYNMTKARPATADTSILLDYLTVSPLEVTQQAFNRSHWKVFYFSIANAVNSLLIVIPWGALSLTAKGDIIIGQFSPQLYGWSIALLLILIVSCFFAWPRDSRRLPCKTTSLFDIWSVFGAGRVARYPELGNCAPTWTREDLLATIHLRHDTYMLGRIKHEGTDDRVGVDVFAEGRSQTPTGYVQWVQPRSSSWLRKVEGQKDIELHGRTFYVKADDNTEQVDSRAGSPDHMVSGALRARDSL